MKKYFALMLHPPRPSFTQDMTPEERALMQQHVAYWTKFMEKGHVVAFGPVMDPKGGYGLGIVGVQEEKEVKEGIAGDPCNGMLRFEYHPMRAVVAGESRV
ncbi:MAG: YciI family protein [Bacteroidota bacterium]|nr:YciI family protein [Bacteroidota bacterium]